uniref:Uncharacterized protein n=1 Tax=Arion vulgaris TaxID=1028688 RepID=A0A0B7BJN3_9EUPU
MKSNGFGHGLHSGNIRAYLRLTHTDQQMNLEAIGYHQRRKQVQLEHQMQGSKNRLVIND